MKKNKKQGGQSQGTEQEQSRNRGSRNGSDTQGNRGGYTPERGRGTQGERNSSSSGGGISNRDMDSEEEQEDLPDRGFEREPGDSER